MLKNVFALSIAATFLIGCSSMTPTSETQKTFEIHDVKVSSGTTDAQIEEAIKTALQDNVSGITINTDIPPSPLPDQPGRFQTSNPLKGSNFAALAAMSGQSLQMTTCEGAILTAQAQNTAMSAHGENTSFTVCLWPYKGGYHIDFYTTFSKSSGGFSAQALGENLARSIVGDSSQKIPKTIQAVVESVKSTGASVTVVDKYYPNI